MIACYLLYLCESSFQSADTPGPSEFPSVSWLCRSPLEDLGGAKEGTGQIIWAQEHFLEKKSELQENPSLLTRSRADPPPKYSMIIQSLVP